MNNRRYPTYNIDIPCESMSMDEYLLQFFDLTSDQLKEIRNIVSSYYQHTIDMDGVEFKFNQLNRNASIAEIIEVFDWANRQTYMKRQSWGAIY